MKQNVYLNNFIKNTERLIKARKMSKQEFCDKAGLSRSSFVNWQKQKMCPSADIVLKISQYFGVTMEWLLTGKKSDGADFYFLGFNEAINKCHKALDKLAITKPSHFVS